MIMCVCRKMVTSFIIIYYTVLFGRSVGQGKERKGNGIRSDVCL